MPRRLSAAVVAQRMKPDTRNSSSSLNSEKWLRFRFVGLDCVSCARIVEQRLEGKRASKRLEYHG